LPFADDLFVHDVFLLGISQKVITILCGESSNLGAVRSTAIPLLKQVLEPLGTTLLNSLKPDWQEEETHFATTSNTTYYQ
jgi:hypothetical protein